MSGASYFSITLPGSCFSNFRRKAEERKKERREIGK